MTGSRRDLFRTALRVASVPLAAALPRPARAATLLRHPYLQNLRLDRVSILWTTQERGAGTVVYSTDRTNWQPVSARVRELSPSETRMRFAQYQYQADLTGLAPNKEYFYRVLVDDEDVVPEEELRFRTAASGPFQFLVFGDSGQTNPQRTQLAQLMNRERPALVLHMGDIAYYQGSFEQFQNEYFRPYAPMMRRAPFFPSPGNHDYETQNAAPYLMLHALPAEDVPGADRGRYYSFDWSNVHFVSLDSNLPLSRAAAGLGPMLDWLDADLRRTRQYWKVVYFHHPPYAAGPNENDPLSILARQHIVPIVEKHGAQLVLAGHEHSYQVTRPLRNGEEVEPGTGTVYLTSGGGGASLYAVYPRPYIAFGESAHHYVRAEVQGARMTLRAFRLDGQEIDIVNLAPLPLLDDDGVVNAASFSTAVAPGSLVSIFGRHLAPEGMHAASAPLPAELGGVTVRANGQRLPLLYVSAYQINAQLPYDLQGEVTLQVTTPNGAAGRRITVAAAAPALFPGASLTHADGSLIAPDAPAQAGETIVIYLTGLGPVNGPAAAGEPAPLARLLTVRAAIEVQVGNERMRPMFAGLAPGFVGLYQINVTLPAGLGSGSHPLRVLAGGVTSNTVSLPVG
jgi:uncharacterized protein (TIGR03437 family)